MRKLLRQVSIALLVFAVVCGCGGIFAPLSISAPQKNQEIPKPGTKKAPKKAPVKRKSKKAEKKQGEQAQDAEAQQNAQPAQQTTAPGTKPANQQQTGAFTTATAGPPPANAPAEPIKGGEGEPVKAGGPHVGAVIAGVAVAGGVAAGAGAALNKKKTTTVPTKNCGLAPSGNAAFAAWCQCQGLQPAPGNASCR